MSALMIFRFRKDEVRTSIGASGEVHFVAADVCKVLGIANARDAISSLHADEKGVANADTLGGRQKLSTVSESGLYALIFKSRKAEAQEFRRWVTKEVLPAIRKTGKFEMEKSPVDTALAALDDVFSASIEAQKRLLAGTLSEASAQAVASLSAQCLRAYEIRLKVLMPVKELEVGRDEWPSSEVGQLLRVAAGRLAQDAWLSLGELLGVAEDCGLLRDLDRESRNAAKALGRRLERWRGRRLVDDRGRGFRFVHQRSAVCARYLFQFEEVTKK